MSVDERVHDTHRNTKKMTKHILIAIAAMIVSTLAAPAAQAYDCWPVRCASTQASVKPGLKKVEDSKQASTDEADEAAQEEEANAADLLLEVAGE